MDKRINPEKLGNAIGANTDDVKKAINGNPSALMSTLTPEDREMLNALMQNKEARDKLLSSPEVNKLISMLMNGR